MKQYKVYWCPFWPYYYYKDNPNSYAIWDSYSRSFIKSYSDYKSLITTTVWVFAFNSMYWLSNIIF